MTIFDYLGLSGHIKQDEYGNAYITIEHGMSFDNTNVFYALMKGIIRTDSDEEIWYMPKEVYDKYCQYSISEMPDNVSLGCLLGIKRPYYRIKGRSFTSQQLADMKMKIKRGENEISSNKADIDSLYVYPGGYNIHTELVDDNGIIDCRDISDKFPTIQEYVLELLNNLIAFPYLKLILVVTALEQGYIEIGDEDIYVGDRDEYFTEENILFGIEAGDKNIKIVDAKAALNKYKEYGL